MVYPETKTSLKPNIFKPLMFFVITMKGVISVTLLNAFLQMGCAQEVKIAVLLNFKYCNTIFKVEFQCIILYNVFCYISIIQSK